MLSFVSAIKIPVTTLLLALFLLMQLAACSPNRTQVSGWWYNQRWEASQANL